MIGKVRTLLTDLLTLSRKENFIGTVVIVHTGYYGINSPRILVAESTYRGADKSLARPTSRYILFDANLVIYI